MKKKIAFIFIVLKSGGSERVAINYIRQLDPDKYDVRIVTLSEASDLLDLIPPGVRMVNFTFSKLKKAIFPLFKELRKIKPDFVFAVDQIVNTVLMLYKPFLNFYHIARVQSMPSLITKYTYYTKYKIFLNNAGIRYADTIIAQTKEMKHEIHKLLKIKNNKIVVQNNPIDINYIDALLKNKAAPFNNSDNKVIAVASGSLDKCKAFDILLLAVKKVIILFPNFKLYILGGDSGEGKKLQALCKELQIEDTILFCGYIDNPYPYYKYCDLFILSSRLEGFPNVLIENYYLNSPIAATRCVPIIEELIVDGRNGFLCDVDNPQSLADAIINTLKIERKNIQNPPYKYGKITDIIESINEGCC